jgi:hypothetical protein
MFGLVATSTIGLWYCLIGYFHGPAVLILSPVMLAAIKSIASLQPMLFPGNAALRRKTPRIGQFLIKLKLYAD